MDVLKLPELTPKEKMFALTYIANGCIKTSAAEAAGCAAAQADKMLVRPQVRLFISQQSEVYLTPLRRKAEWVLFRLEHILDLCSNENSEFWNPVQAIRAAELLGRHYKLFTDQLEITANEDLGQRIRDAKERARKLKIKMGITGGGDDEDEETIIEDVEDVEDEETLSNGVDAPLDVDIEGVFD